MEIAYPNYEISVNNVFELAWSISKLNPNNKGVITLIGLLSLTTIGPMLLVANLVPLKLSFKILN